MKVLIVIIFCLSSVLANIYQCPGGRIEYRKTGKFCCYDIQDTTCYKVISHHHQNDETLFGDEEERMSLPLIRTALGVGRLLLNLIRTTDDRQGRTSTQGIDKGCNERYPLDMGTRCCTRFSAPRTCIYKTTDERLQDQPLAYELLDEILGD